MAKFVISVDSETSEFTASVDGVEIPHPDSVYVSRYKDYDYSSSEYKEKVCVSVNTSSQGNGVRMSTNISAAQALELQASNKSLESTMDSFDKAILDAAACFSKE